MPDARHTPGSAAWHDLTVPNAAEVAAFYAAVLNVTPSPVPMGAYDDFNLVPAGEPDPVAGVCHARGRNAGLPATWLIYFVVDHLDESLRVCEERGGRLLAGPSSAGAGAYAVVEDPSGAVCALFQYLDERVDEPVDEATHEEHDLDDVEVIVSPDMAQGDRHPDDENAVARTWRLESASADLIEEVVFASLLVASGGEGDIDGAELQTIMGSLAHRFGDVGSDLQLESLARAIERFTMAPVSDFTTSIAEFGAELPREGRRAILDDLSSVAYADGAVHPMERTLLRHIAEAWGLPSPVPEDPAD